MTSDFTADFFAGNRKRLQHLLATDMPIVLAAHGELQAGGDNTFPFHQDSNFLYLTGINHANYTLVIEATGTYLIAPEHSDIKDLFDGGVDLAEVTRQSGINTILDAKTGWQRLQASLQAAKQVATPFASPAYIAQIGMYTNPARARLVRRLKRLVSGLQLTDIRPQLASLRVVKQPMEIAAITKAIDITCATLNDVRQHPYAYEYQLEADITQGFRSRGARGHAYGPIVAGGKNACTLHYDSNADQLQTDDLVLADVGAEYNRYAADLTRTWACGKPSSRQQAVFDAVNEAVVYGLEQLKPGPSFYECEQRVRDFVGKKLKDLGLTKVVNHEVTHRYYPHAPHYLGLDVHDVGDYRQPLAAGMVLTIEPGIYIPEEGIGVRLEEDILITQTGNQVLSAACPRELTRVQ